MKKKVAIVGGGIAGITSAYLLQQTSEVTLFEREYRIGGHTNTVEVQEGPDAGLAIDTGFIVLNDRTYPNLHKLFREWGVAVRWSDMSFGYYCEKTQFSYAGRGLSGLFAQRVNIFRPWFYSFVREIYRFCHRARVDLGSDSLDGVSLAAYLARYKYSQRLVDEYVIPLGGAIWSAPDEGMRNFPAALFLRFLENHGLLTPFDRPRWQTVVGGSYRYVEAFRKIFPGNIRERCSVSRIKRKEDGVYISSPAGDERFDAVIIATHGDEALRLLEDPSDQESRLLGAWKYEKNHVALHTDCSFLPPLKGAWASWNYRRELDQSSQVKLSVTYYMNYLQGIVSDRHYCVTLNPRRPIEQSSIIFETTYEHPIYDFHSVKTHAEISSLQGSRNTWFAGSYQGFGFHEDAVRSAISVAQGLGVTWE